MPEVTEVSRQQKSEAIARAIGWTPDKDFGGWLSPGGTQGASIPDFFSPEGAQAREEAENWLQKQSHSVLTWYCMGKWWSRYEFAFGSDIPDGGCHAFLTRHEAIAEALYAAVVAMGGENG